SIIGQLLNSACQLVSCGGLSSSTMIVMITAITPSVKASSRFFSINKPSREARLLLFLSPPLAGGGESKERGGSAAYGCTARLSQAPSPHPTLSPALARGRGLKKSLVLVFLSHAMAGRGRGLKKSPRRALVRKLERGHLFLHVSVGDYFLS